MVKVGDRFFVTYGIRRTDVVDATFWIRVTKIGKRWAEFQREDWNDGSRTKDNRFDMETMRLDGAGFTSPGTVWKSEEDWRENTRLQALWTELRRKIDRAYTIPPGATQIGILKAADALGIKLESE